jgi:hypothetical protein
LLPYQASIINAPLENDLVMVFLPALQAWAIVCSTNELSVHK